MCAPREAGVWSSEQDFATVYEPIGYEDKAGSGVAIGDVDQDGFPDHLIGAPYASEGEGTAYLNYGPVLGTHSLADAHVTFTSAGDGLGDMVGLGDVNGDGYDDTILAEWGDPFAGTSGPIVVLLTPPAEDVYLEHEAVQIFETEAHGSFNVLQANADLTGDGLNDLVVGSSTHTAPGVIDVPVVEGPIEEERWLADSTIGFHGGEFDWFGYDLSAHGDANNDGHTDLLVGAPGEAADRGRAYLFYGPFTGVRYGPDAEAIFLRTSRTAYMGSGVALTDLTADGYADAAIGADGLLEEFPDYKSGVYLVYGPLSGTYDLEAGDGDAAFYMPDSDDGRCCDDVRPAQDINLDGYGDLVVGGPSAGSTWILFGGALASE